MTNPITRTTRPHAHFRFQLPQREIAPVIVPHHIHVCVSRDPRRYDEVRIIAAVAQLHERLAQDCQSPTKSPWEAVALIIATWQISPARSAREGQKLN